MLRKRVHSLVAGSRFELPLLQRSVSRILEGLQECALLCSSRVALCTSAQLGWEENPNFKLEKQPQSVFWCVLLYSVGADSSRWTNSLPALMQTEGTWTQCVWYSADKDTGAAGERRCDGWREPFRSDHTLCLWCLYQTALWRRWLRPPRTNTEKCTSDLFTSEFICYWNKHV